MAISNVYYFDQTSNKIKTDFSLYRGSENDSIAYRMYKGESINTFPLPDKLKSISEKFYGKFSPPEWINDYMKSRLLTSNFLFSVLYILLPLFIVISFFGGSKKYYIEQMILITSFGNALVYSIAYLPIDRYLMPGYPVLLLVYLMMFYRIFKMIMLAFLKRKTVDQSIL